jgi:hypothetical protein
MITRSLIAASLLSAAVGCSGNREPAVPIDAVRADSETLVVEGPDGRWELVVWPAESDSDVELEVRRPGTGRLVTLRRSADLPLTALSRDEGRIVFFGAAPLNATSVSLEADDGAQARSETHLVRRGDSVFNVWAAETRFVGQVVTITYLADGGARVAEETVDVPTAAVSLP